MPYATNEDLPPSVRHVLPYHAQDIFRAAFNNTWRNHDGEPGQEEISFRTAWAAVKRFYEKTGGTWIPRNP
jgi:cation transport regulator